ncbi:MAG: hypothetical protein AAGI07_07620 [Bacteroidota bacterium]
MSFFDKIYNKLFSNGKGNSKEAFVSEQLIRGEQYKRDYFRWINEGIYKIHLDSIYSAYQKKLQKIDDEFKVHVLSTPYANGFALSYHPSLSTSDFSFLFDYFKDQAVNLGYQLNNSGRKIYDRPNYVEAKEKFYLKPPLQDIQQGELFDQMYGNILIEQILVDSKPSYMKFVANIYSDRLYTKALEFEELLSKVFGK